MSKPDPINSVTVKLGERQITLVRSELEQNDAIKLAIAQFDRVREDIADVDYERQKLAHAHLSMQAQLNRLCTQYAEEKFPEFKSNKDSEND